jgi:hypothetical protein
MNYRRVYILALFLGLCSLLNAQLDSLANIKFKRKLESFLKSNIENYDSQFGSNKPFDSLFVLLKSIDINSHISIISLYKVKNQDFYFYFYYNDYEKELILLKYGRKYCENLIEGNYHLVFKDIYSHRSDISPYLIHDLIFPSRFYLFRKIDGHLLLELKFISDTSNFSVTNRLSSEEINMLKSLQLDSGNYLLVDVLQKKYTYIVNTSGTETKINKQLLNFLKQHKTEINIKQPFDIVYPTIRIKAF